MHAPTFVYRAEDEMTFRAVPHGRAGAIINPNGPPFSSS